MKLELDTRIAYVSSVSAWESLRQCSTVAATTIEPSVWVRLLNPPTAFSFDEAWLLCQVSENQWLGWVPDYGEIVLNPDEFVVLS